MASFSKGFAQGFVPNFGPMLNNAMQLDSRNRALQLQRAWQQEQLARDDERARIADNERQIRLKLALEADTRAKEDQVRQEGRYQGGLKQTQIEDESALEAIASMFPGAENSEKAKIAFNVWKAKRQLPDQVDPNKALDAEATGLGHEVKRAYDQASDLRRLAATVPATDMATRKKYLDQADDTERSVAPYVRRRRGRGQLQHVLARSAGGLTDRRARQTSFTRVLERGPVGLLCAFPRSGGPTDSGERVRLHGRQP